MEIPRGPLLNFSGRSSSAVGVRARNCLRKVSSSVLFTFSGAKMVADGFYCVWFVLMRQWCGATGMDKKSTFSYKVCGSNWVRISGGCHQFLVSTDFQAVARRVSTERAEVRNFFTDFQSIFRDFICGLMVIVGHDERS